MGGSCCSPDGGKPISTMGALVFFWDRMIQDKVYRLITPVLFNMLFTLWAWTSVYEMKQNEELISKLFYNTGSNFSDALMNGAAVMATLICTVFFLLALVLLDFRRLIQCWLYIACISVLFAVSGGFFHDAMLKFIPNSGEQEFLILGSCTGVFGVVGLVAYFTDMLPPIVHQFYVLINCSFVSLIYLRILPGYTPWVVLAALVFWDLFAVLTPYGPLRIVQEKAADYGADVLRFLMFTAENRDETNSTDDLHSEGPVNPNADLAAVNEQADSSSGSDTSSSSDSGDSSSSDSSDDESPSESKTTKKGATAADALNDDSSRLGMGDFVFYGVLVGAAASNGSVLATVAAVYGIIIGLMLTFTVPFNTEYTIPAIPLSVCIGSVYHIMVLYIESTVTKYMQ